jgi:hypothetical protein
MCVEENGLVYLDVTTICVNEMGKAINSRLKFVFYDARVIAIVQVTLVICAFAVSVFAYPRVYFSIMRSINILTRPKFKTCCLRQTFSRLIKE